MLSQGTVLDEVAEIIHLPEYNSKVQSAVNVDDISLSPNEVQQLRELVSRFAQSYAYDNAFHNFDHASHVVMVSVS